ncbi:hypothetical protein LXL04_035405 [Taraxacum kok-saghyz]
MLWMWEHQLRSCGLLRSGKNCWNSMKVSGARMHASFIRPGGVAQDPPLGLCRDIDFSTQQFASRIDELEEMSSDNRIWKQRLVDICTLTAQQAKDWDIKHFLLQQLLLIVVLCLKMT